MERQCCANLTYYNAKVSKFLHQIFTNFMLKESISKNRILKRKFKFGKKRLCAKMLTV